MMLVDVRTAAAQQLRSSSSAQADDAVATGGGHFRTAPWAVDTGCPAFAGHDEAGGWPRSVIRDWREQSE